MRKKKMKKKKMNKNTMNVYLQYPWKIADSSYYKNLTKFPPKNTNYINIKKENFELLKSRKMFLLSKNLKSMIRIITNSLNLPIPNVHLTKSKEKYGLIHCAHCLSANNSPWVMDLESIWQLWISGMNTKKGKEKVKKLLLSENCKKIMPWTEDTKNKISEFFHDENINEKIEIVPHAINIPKLKKIKHAGVNLLFTARYFYEKGGLETLDVFDILTKKYSYVNAIFISEAPKEILEKYSKNKKIKFLNLINQEKLFNEIYPKTDIIIYPGYSDSYGFLFIESAAFGIPIITLDGNARGELVLDKKTGFIGIKPIINWKNNLPNIKNKKEIINNLIINSKKLIKDEKLRKRMAYDSRKFAISKFSIEKRNKQIERIYQEAIK